MLLRGKTGTGKELFARLIYELSRRRSAPFMAVHCSAIEETLLGSVLFGHEKGVFTGAVGMKKGLFEEADHGTIFLDEIGELSHGMQVKLLRVLQEGEFMRLGGNKTIRVDVRVIAATNRDLEKAVRDNLFREDLYYRLKVIEIVLPMLAERRDDIPELVRYFIRTLGAESASAVREVADDAMAALQAYSWPGNIRELRNVIERSLVLAEGATLTFDDLPPEIGAASDHPACALGLEDWSTGQMNLDGLQKRHIERMLKECGGNKRLTAQRLGISRSTLYEKLKDLDHQ